MKNIIIETEKYKYEESKIKIAHLLRHWAPIYIAVNLAETLSINKACLTDEFRQLSNKTYGDTRYVINFYNDLQDDPLHQIMWVDHLLGYAYTTEHLITGLIEAGFTKENATNYVLDNLDNLKAFDLASAFVIAKKNLQKE